MTDINWAEAIVGTVVISFGIVGGCLMLAWLEAKFNVFSSILDNLR